VRKLEDKFRTIVSELQKFNADLLDYIKEKMITTDDLEAAFPIGTVILSFNKDFDPNKVKFYLGGQSGSGRAAIWQLITHGSALVTGSKAATTPINFFVNGNPITGTANDGTIAKEQLPDVELKVHGYTSQEMGTYDGDSASEDTLHVRNFMFNVDYWFPVIDGDPSADNAVIVGGGMTKDKKRPAVNVTTSPAPMITVPRYVYTDNGHDVLNFDLSHRHTMDNVKTKNMGEGKSITRMQKSIAVYAWRRTS
jgi:hypothetical protein